MLILLVQPCVGEPQVRPGSKMVFLISVRLPPLAEQDSREYLHRSPAAPDTLDTPGRGPENRSREPAQAALGDIFLLVHLEQSTRNP